MEPVITFIAFLATVFGVMFVYYTTRHKERLALIEKGADASLFSTGKEGSKSTFSWSKFTLKVGMLAMGIAVGIIAGAMLANIGILKADEIIPGMIFFFGGLSLVLFYLLSRSQGLRRTRYRLSARSLACHKRFRWV